MPDTCAPNGNNSGVDLIVTGTRNIKTESAPRTTPSCEESVGMAQPDASHMQIDETNQALEDKERQQQDEDRSSEEVSDTMLTSTLHSLRSSSASSSTSSTSSSSTATSSVTPPPGTPPSPKSSGVSVALDHPRVVVEKVVGVEEHMLALSIGERNDAKLSSTASLDFLRDPETSTGPTSSPSSSTSSLPQVTFRVPTSASAINISETGLDHESYGLLSLLRPAAASNRNLGVRFAPLPELAPRKRKSSMPLGMAARSQLTRRRRMYQGTYEDRDPYRPRLYVHAEFQPDEGNNEVDSPEIRMLKKKVLDKLRKEEEEGLEEDSLVVLAKKMGSVGKHLFKKMLTQKAPREGLDSPNGQRAASPGVTVEPPTRKTEEPVTALPPVEEKNEEKTELLEVKAQVWKNKLHKIPLRNSLTPTLSAP